MQQCEEQGSMPSRGETDRSNEPEGTELVENAVDNRLVRCRNALLERVFKLLEDDTEQDNEGGQDPELVVP